MYELGVTCVRVSTLYNLVVDLEGILAKAKKLKRETTWGYMVKKLSAQGECLGSKRRRKTWQPAKSPGELATSTDPRISEWGNPIEEILSS